jgi:hypothetical protein
MQPDLFLFWGGTTHSKRRKRIAQKSGMAHKPKA